MTSGSAGPARVPGTEAPVRRPLRDRLGIIERRLRRLPPVRGVLAVTDAYNTGGGGLFASGLAFSALFAVIPALLLIVSLLVIAVDDAGTRTKVIDWLVTTIPPLEEVANSIVTNLATGARIGTVVGLIGFIWGASGFYMALQGAMERFFPGPHAHDPVHGRLRGVLAVAVVVIAVMIAFLASTGVGLVTHFFHVPWDDVLPVVSPVLAVAVAAGICLAVYRVVPSDPPSRRAATVPALCAGVFIGLLTSLFGLLTSTLIQGVVGLGAIASVFIALIWFNYVFQALLYGAAYARIRRDRERVSMGPPSI